MKSHLNKKMIQVLILIEFVLLVFCLAIPTVFHMQKMKNKAQLFVDAARNDLLIGDSRALQQKIILAVREHEFKSINFIKDGSVDADSPVQTFFEIRLETPVLSSTQDDSSRIGSVIFMYSLGSSFLEGVLIWLVLSILILLQIPLFNKVLKRQIREEMERENQKALLKIATQVAHDVRSPLSALQMMAKAPDLNTDEARGLLVGTAQRISTIAQDLVDKVKRDQAAKSFELADLNKIVEEVVAEKKYEYQKYPDIMIEFSGTAGTYARVRKDDLKRVLSNLINNSVEAKDKKICRIEISLTQGPKGALIKIVDNGCGISMELLRDMRKRKIQSQKQGNSGLGIGLQSAYESIKFMGGEIFVNSVENVGTTFSIGLRD